VTARLQGIETGWSWPAAGYCRRMAAYLRAMFPIALHGPLALLLFANLAWLLRRHLPGQPGSVRAAVVALFSMIALDLLIRMMDEIKDKDLDARYHPTRPLPAGVVTESDLRWSQLLVAGAFLAAATTSPATVLGAVGLLAYSVALSRHLLMRPLLERSPLLTLLTHSPLVPLVLLYVAALLLAAGGFSLADLPRAALTLSLTVTWLSLVTVEIARKTRVPQREDGYPTYSAIWGLKPAIMAALAAATAALLLAVVLARLASPSLLVLAPCIGGYLWLAAECVRGLATPAPARWRLKSAAHAFAALTLMAFPLGGWLSP